LSLAEFKRVHAGLELNTSKTCNLPKDITQQSIFDVTYDFINVTPQLTQFSGEVFLDSFHPDGFVGIGVNIVTDTFVIRQLTDVQDITTLHTTPYHMSYVPIPSSSAFYWHSKTD
jgi:hypothetical protein